MSKFDAGSGAKGAGRGALSGAAIGAVGGPWGAAIGAGIGGGLGFLGGAWNKKENYTLPTVELDPLRSIRQEPRGEFEQMLRNRARGTGLTDQRQFELTNQLEQIPGQAQGLFQSGVSQLASSGGVTGGARERLARAAQDASFKARQQARQGAVGGSIEDRLRSQSELSQQEAGERQFDIRNELERQKMNAQLEASRNMAQAQMNMQNQDKGLLGLGMFGL